MPELPEVETVMRGIEPFFEVAKILSIDIHRYDLRRPIPDNFANIFRGQNIKSLRRRGKYILAFCENGKGFVLHLGMSGRVQVYQPGETFTREKHDHVVFNMVDHTRIVFNDPRRFGMLYLTDEKSWQAEKPFSAMGPEPLGNDFNAGVLARKLEKKRVPIKNALLDQHIVAGLGNIYVCEALYYSGIHPARLSCDVTAEELERLVVQIRGVLKKAIAAGGSSLKDYKHADGQLGYFQHEFAVYNREGELCPNAQGDDDAHIIKRIVQSGRSTFFCEACQN